jgi:hypothetical protein
MKNPGWAGETGEFDLTEADVRGIDYVGPQPAEGWDPGGVGAYPYQRAERDPEAPLFEGPYRARLEKILGRYPNPGGAAAGPEPGAGDPGPSLAGGHGRGGRGGGRGAGDGAGRGHVLHHVQQAPRGAPPDPGVHERELQPVRRPRRLQGVPGAHGTEPGAISEDGEFTVIEAECLGACGFPTAVQINNRYFENVEPEDVPAILSA